MKRISNFFWFLYKIFAFYTLVVFALILWIPSDGWLAGFMMMSFPGVIVMHVLAVPVWYFVEKKKALLPLVLLLIGCIFLPRTFSFGNKSDTLSNSLGDTFSVMSYNTHVFMKNSDLAEHPTLDKDIESMKSWVAHSGADILVMPEYYESTRKPFNIHQTLESAGYRYSVKFATKVLWRRKDYWGLALFSKYPVVASRDTIFESQNGMLQADVLIGSDTVSVIGLHLYSMTLNLSKLAHQKEMDGIKKEGKFTFARMKSGFIRRSEELLTLESWIHDSPYPVIVCGDFNEVPYGYVYGKLRKSMNNGFEEKGEGFGFTFNHIPYFIRIDHQFYSPGRLNIVDFKTLNKIRYSDHYPIMGTYQLLNEK